MRVSDKLEKIEGPFNTAAIMAGSAVVISFYEDDYSGPDNISVEYVGLDIYKIQDAELREDGVVVAASGEKQSLDKSVIDDLAKQVQKSTGLELRVS